MTERNLSKTVKVPITWDRASLINVNTESAGLTLLLDLDNPY
jgi:hypothetical protein